MKLTCSLVVPLFREYLIGRSYSPSTLNRYVWEAKLFFMFLSVHREKEDLREVTRKDIETFRVFLYHAVKDDEARRFGESTRCGILSTVRGLFRFFQRRELILTNPFDGIELRGPKHRPLRRTLSEKEMDALLKRTEEETVFDVRDRSFFELLYGTGLRVSEACQLDVSDADLAAGRVFVRKGKGNKERVVPLGRHAASCLKEYLEHRPWFLRKTVLPEHRPALFLGRFGRRLYASYMGKRLNCLLKRAGLATEGISPHILRHSFATHMLEGGADVSHLKVILGHVSLQTTMIYTHVSAQNLKKLMKRYHPRENELYEEVPYDEEFVKALPD